MDVTNTETTDVLAASAWSVDASLAIPGPRSPADVGGFYRPELDGLRFLAFIAVYMQHTIGFGIAGNHQHLPNWLGDLFGTIGLAGTFGVDLFFVLSSYLITELLLRERVMTGVLDVKAFYIRRMLRIWPLYFLFIVFAYGFAFAIPGEELTWRHLLGYFLFAGNWVYFLIPVTTVAGPLWSVSLEEQFYLVWPWLMRGASERRLVQFAGALMIFAMAARLAMGIVHPGDDWVSKNSFTRVDGIAVGALLALTLNGGVPQWRAGTRAALAAACVLVLLWIAYTFGLFEPPVRLPQLMFGWAFAAIACGGLLLSVLGDAGPFTALLRSRPFIYLGRISFGLYVYHELLLTVGAPLFPLHDSSASQMAAYWLFGLAGSIVMAAASYRWLELPFLRLKRQRFTVVESRRD